MNPLEKPQTTSPKSSPAEDVLHPKIRNLLDTGPTNSYNLRQIQLAAERFGPSHPHDTMDKGLMDNAVEAWNNSEYRQGWHDMVNDQEFKTSKFHGDFSKVSLEDLDEYMRTRQLPKSGGAVK